MEIQLGYYPQLFLLVLARAGAIIGSVTILGKGRVAPRIRVAIALSLAILFTPMLAANNTFATVHLTNAFEVTIATLNEILLGMVIGLTFDIVFTACQLAGFIVGFGSSLTMAQVVDPASGISTDIIGTILQLTCFMVFVLNDAHLVLIRLMYQSFAILPLNPSAWLTHDLFSDIVQLLQKAYEWGIKLAAPAIAISFLLDLSLGLMSRMAPNFDILFMSLPIRLFAGLITFGMMLRYGGSFFSHMCEFTEGFCSRILVG